MIDEKNQIVIFNECQWGGSIAITKKRYTVKPRIWNTDRSAAKVFHMRGSIFGVIYQINAIFMQ